MDRSKEVFRQDKGLERSAAPSTPSLNPLMFRSLVLLALASTGCNHPKDTAVDTDGSSIELIDESTPLLKVHKGEWDFPIFEMKPVLITNQYGNTLYAYIRGRLAAEGSFPGEIPQEDEQALIEAIIDACAHFNPQIVDLDAFETVNGKEIQFPSVLTMNYAASGKEDSYKRLQELAEMDGFPIGDETQRARLFQEGVESGVKVGTGEGYFRAAGYEASPDSLQGSALERFKNASSKFKDSTGGWSWSYTHVLRDEAMQKMQKNDVEATTHYTGRTIDITDGRFLDPSGKEVTWGTNPEHRTLIEETFRPLIVALLLAEGAVVFPEPKGGHYHVYFPERKVIDFEAQPSVRPPSVGPQAPAPTPTPELNPGSSELKIVNDHLWEVLNEVASSEPPALSDEVLKQQMDALKVDYDLTKNGGTRWFLNILMTFNTEGLVLSPSEEAMSVKEIQAKIDSLASNRKLNQDSLTQWVMVRNQKIYNQAVRLGLTMTPEQSRQYRPLQGTTLDSTRLGNYSDLSVVWKNKVEKKSKSVDRERGLYTHTRTQLEGRSNSVNMKDWAELQLKACDLFQKYGTSMDFDARIVPYMTPPLILAVTNAEFASEFEGSEYIDIAPMVFHDQNLVFGPAGNDDYYSAGVVQMIASTQEGLFGEYKEQIELIKRENPDYGLVLPSYVDIPIKSGKMVRRYDAAEQAQAQLTHLPSQFFYGTLAVANHIERGINTLFADTEFVKAWEAASEADRTIFLAAFSAMSINIGRGGANTVATKLVEMAASTSLRDYTDALNDSNYNGKKFGRRNALVGGEAMRAMLREADIPVYVAETKVEPQAEPKEGFRKKAARWIGSWFN